MEGFTVYRGKCSPGQLRNVLLMAMTIKDIKEIEEAMLKAGVKTPQSADYIFLPANWYRGNSRINRVEFCDHEYSKLFRQNGIVVSPVVGTFSVPRKTEYVMGVSFWDLATIKKRSKSGNFFEASRDLNILLMSERGDGPPFTVAFDVCVRERVIVTEWGFKMHSRWLDFLRAAGVEYYEEVQE